MAKIKGAQADLKLAQRVLPPPLLAAIYHIFGQDLPQAWLVGGTALAGFYAGHRKSDDIDLFVADAFTFKAAVLAAKSLTVIGGVIHQERSSQQYYNGQYSLDGHHFTVDIVLDAHLHKVGNSQKLEHITVADLETIFMMKSATLVSRCSEKDLYDLLWLLQYFDDRSVADLIAAGRKIDQGVAGEAILLSLAGAILRQDACDFGLEESGVKIYGQITAFRERLEREIATALRGDQSSKLGELARYVKKSLN